MYIYLMIVFLHQLEIPVILESQQKNICFVV